MGTTTKKINYAIQRQNPAFDDWDTIRTSITPHEARARRLMRWQQSLRTRFQFRRQSRDRDDDHTGRRGISLLNREGRSRTARDGAASSRPDEDAFD